MVDSIRQQEVKELTWGWSLIFFLGLASIVVGIVFLFKPGDSITTLAVIAGIFLLLDGILELLSAFLHGTTSRGLIALFGVITAVIGVLLIRHPVGGVTAVALLIGIWLIAIGVIRFVTAFEEHAHRVWYAFAGLLELVAGIVIVSSPNIGYTTLAILVGIGFILNGIGIAALGWGMHQIRRAAS